MTTQTTDRIDGRTREARALRQGAPSENELFLASNPPDSEKTTEIFVSQDTQGPDAADLSPIELEHTRAGRKRMWVLTGTGSVPRWISKNSLADAIRCGMSPTCHDCGGDHGEGVNDCPGRAKRQFRTCPKPGCGKRLFDPQPTGKYLLDPGEHNDEMEISNDDLGASTPGTRTMMLVRRHVETFHKDDLLVFFPDARRELEAVR